MSLWTKMIRLLPVFLLTGCVTVDSISVSQIPVKSQRKRLVQASASRPIILWIPFGTGFVEEARQQLAGQCAAGEIEGLVSKQESVTYFYLLGVASSRLSLKGYCVEQSSKKAKAT